MCESCRVIKHGKTVSLERALLWVEEKQALIVVNPKEDDARKRVMVVLPGAGKVRADGSGGGHVIAYGETVYSAIKDAQYALELSV